MLEKNDRLNRCAKELAKLTLHVRQQNAELEKVIQEIESRFQKL